MIKKLGLIFILSLTACDSGNGSGGGGGLGSSLASGFAAGAGAAAGHKAINAASDKYKQYKENKEANKTRSNHYARRERVINPRPHLARKH